MKSRVLCCLCVLGFQIVTAQVTMVEKADCKPLSELKSLGSTMASIEYSVSGRDKIHLLIILDFTKRGENAEPRFFSIRFNGIDDTFENFYQLLKSFFLDENRKNKKYTQTFRLGEQMVDLQHSLLITGKGVRLSTKDGYINLSKGNSETLFQKE